MTALDQAFIKAYQQQAPGPAPSQSEDAQPAADEQPVEDPQSAETTEDVPQLSPEGLADAMERTPARLAVPVAGPSSEASEPAADASSEATAPAPVFLRFKASDTEGTSIDAASTFAELGIVGTFHRVDESHAQQPAEDADTEEASAPDESAEVEAVPAPDAEPDPTADQDRIDEETPAVESSQETAEETTAGPLKPMLQVDHFTWPRVCRRLEQTAGDELDRLGEALLAELARGRKVVAFGGCRAGEGATTLALCAAHELSQRGLRVALVDANLSSPDLGTLMGLRPQHGFEEVLAGRMPLDEIVIESADGRMGVVPLCEAFAGTGGPRDDETRMAESLARLAGHYEAVIVDLGPLEDPDVVTGSLARAVGRKLDTVVLVHNVRDTDPTAVAEVQRCLTAAGISQSGVIENFVEA